MSTTSNKKKKKKVVKRVIKKKIIKKQPISNGYSPKPNYGHTKINPIPTGMQKNRTRTPSIHDAITRFTQIIEDQTKFIEKLKQENQKLKNEVEQLKNRPPEKIYIRKSITNNERQLKGPPPRKLPIFSTATKSNPITITTTPPHNNGNSGGVVTNISQADAKNALAGLFGATKPNSKPNPSSGVVTNISQADAKNALAGLFAAKKPPGLIKAKSAMTLPKPKHNNDDEKGNDINLAITTPFRLIKYVKLGKIMPVHVVENRMKMDGVTKILIAQLTQQWMKACVPNNVKILDQEVAPPPSMAKEFSDLIDSKENEFNTDDDNYEKIIALGLKPKRKIIPSRKMKRFHWKKIEAELIPPTLWKELDDALVVFNKIEFELKFQFRTPRPTQRKNLSKKDRTGQIYTFILPKRSQNIQIALSRFKMTDEQLKTAVIEMDESVFTIDALESFIEMAPTEDEQREAELHAHKLDVDVAYFGRCEKFFYSFIDIVDLTLRLELWLFMQNFKEIVSDKQAQIYKLQSGIRALTTSVSFKNVLQVLLAWGNHMNAGSHAGQAYGFEIDSLGLLPGIKTMDTSMNLMMYLYKTLYEKFPEYLDVIVDLKSIKVCATMETDMLDKSVTQIKEKFELLQATLTRFEEDYLEVLPMDDKFIEYTRKWIKQNRKHLTKLIMMHKRTKNKCRHLSVLFNWDLEQNRIESLFAICNTFISDLYKARDDIHKLEIEREKRRRRQKRKKKQQVAKQQHKKQQRNLQKKKFAITSGQKHKRSIMDDVLNRKRKNTAILKKLGGKLERSLVEKSKLIEATNYKKKLPEVFKKNKVKRKMSSVYNERVKGSKPVAKGRMRLPTLVSKKGLPSLPALKQGNEKFKAGPNIKYQNNIKVTKRSRIKRKRKRTKGWFEKGKEPKVNPNSKGLYNPWSAFAAPNMSYNPLAQYDYKSAHKRGRGISNNKETDDMKSMGNRWRSDTPKSPKSPTALTQISKEDLKKGKAVAKKWSDAQHPSLKKKFNFGGSYSDGINVHKRAQSMKMHSSKNRLNRAAYSPPNMGIVRLNKLGISGGYKTNVKAKKKSGADLNIPKHLADGGDEFLLMESPAVSPEPKRMSGQYKFTEENNWD